MIELPPPRSRWKLFLVAGALLLVVAAGLVVLAVWTTRSPEPPPLSDPPPADTVPAPLDGHRPCRAVQLFFPQDADMTAASDTFHGDPRVLRVFVETRAESYARFKVVFKDDEELLRAVRPESLSASVQLTAKPGTDLEAFAAELRPRYPAVKEVKVQDGDKLVAQVPKESRAAWPPCPASGEY